MKIQDYLEYHPSTGKVFWKKTKGNRAPAGTECTTLNIDGYFRIKFDGKGYLLHRVIWFLYHGYFPENQIDHINGDKIDNRIVNLREVSPSCNMRNQKVNERNKSGVTGVSWDARRNKWVVHITVGNKVRKICRRDDFLEAVCHRLAAEQATDWLQCQYDSSAFKFVKHHIPTIKP